MNIKDLDHSRIPIIKDEPDVERRFLAAGYQLAFQQSLNASVGFENELGALSELHGILVNVDAVWDSQIKGRVHTQEALERVQVLRKQVDEYASGEWSMTSLVRPLASLFVRMIDEQVIDDMRKDLD